MFTICQNEEFIYDLNFKIDLHETSFIKKNFDLIHTLENIRHPRISFGDFASLEKSVA